MSITKVGAAAVRLWLDLWIAISAIAIIIAALALGLSDSTALARCAACPRDSSGRITRSREARIEFERATGHLHGWPGHVEPLACGGADAPSNMQWQTTAAAKAKDVWERRGCER
jgi:hypothetical protein